DLRPQRAAGHDLLRAGRGYRLCRRQGGRRLRLREGDLPEGELGAGEDAEAGVEQLSRLAADVHRLEEHYAERVAPVARDPNEALPGGIREAGLEADRPRVVEPHQRVVRVEVEPPALDRE